MGKHRKWSSEQKFEIAIQALKGDATLNDICKRYEVAPSQVKEWKKQLLEKGVAIFSKNDQGTEAIHKFESEQSKLYEKIGQLTVERDFLKKVWSKFHGNSEEN
jgi:transposase